MNEHRVTVDLVGETDDPILLPLFERLSNGAVGLVNIHRTLANSPDVFHAFIGLAHALRFKTGLDPAERELAILRALARHKGDYEIVHHRKMGLAAGLSEMAVAAACLDAGEDDLSPRQMLLLRFADRFAEGNGVDAETAASLRDALGNRGVIELSLTLALYVGLAHLTGALDVPLD
jgi:alkylhydroperoxidase family enzyme